MKKLSFFYPFLVAILSIFVISCEDNFIPKPDDGDTNEDYSTLIEQLNANLSSLQTIVTASLNNKDMISDIDTLRNDGNDIGYVFTLDCGRTFTIYNADASCDLSIPAISVIKEWKYYYWTLNGEHLLDFNGNNRVVKSYDYQPPILNIENQNWIISFDGGKLWRYGK